MDKQIEKLMAKLGITEAEAKQLAEDDKRIEKGENLFPLTKEQEKASKEMRGTGTKAPTVYKFNKRERKANNDKQFLINAFDNLLNEICGQVEVTNAEREIVFFYNEKKYKIVLSAPRT